MALAQLDPRLAAVVAEIDRRRRRERFAAGELLSPAQVACWTDEARDQVWPCGRRAGKTDLAEKLLLRAVTGDRVQAIYVSTTIKRAMATVWDEIVDLNDTWGLGGVPNVGKSSIAFPATRSKIIVTGCESKAMANDIRGRKRVALYVVDECQDWNDELLRYFVEEVVHWSKADVRGRSVLAGTGGRPRGFWARACASDSTYSRHTWTAFDNPFLAEGEARALIDKACKDRGCDETDPSIQREFYARFVADLQRQIFPYDAAKNGYATLPKGRWRYVVSADFGTVDATAVGALGWCDTDPRLWLVKHKVARGLGSTAQLALYRDYLAEFGEGLSGAVGDPGGGGAGLIKDLGHGPNGVAVEAAEKQGKPAACLLMRDALRTGALVVPAGDEALIRDLTEPEWDPDNIGTAIKGHMPDVVDMLLYGFRKARSLNWYRPPEPQEPATPAREMERRFEEFDAKAGRVDDDAERW